MARYFNGTFSSLLKQLEEHIARAKAYFDTDESTSIEALVLGGGYGRGEGGVFVDGDTPKLFNDLDYFLFTESPEDDALRKRVKAFERTESEALSIDVEVTCVSPGNLKNAESSMMFHDLIMGHLVVVGPDDYLAKWHSKMDPKLIHKVEATRLLWNRGSGLFFARCKLEVSGAEDFIYRQHMKLALALGDAVLCISGQHNAFCETRKQLVAALEHPLLTDEIRQLHATGVDFKQRPVEPPMSLDLKGQNDRLRSLWLDVYLAVEGERLGRSFGSADQYAKANERLFPDESPLRCLALALRDRLKRGAALQPYTDYPRGALMRALVQLNAETPDFVQVGKNLPIENTEWNAIYNIYEVWWGYYS
ncbi:MAG: hypothetical protein AAFX93_01440 [Verrucomicrobiota bacterium]